jgi:predicted regulator of amino acid metabolism with ACT domain
MTREMSIRIGKVVNAFKDHLTIDDMAAEFDLDGQSIRRYCKWHGIKVITPKQALINYMHTMKGHKTLEKIATSTGYNVAYLYILIKSLGENTDDYKIVPVIKRSFTEIRTAAAAREQLMERLEARSTGPHFKDKYTQSGTPFGLADQLRGIDRQP